MNIAFFGTPDFTTAFLDVLEQFGYAPSLIVTNPDAPKGRGMVLQSPLPKTWADTRSISVIQPEKITEDVIAELQSKPWDLFVVIAYGKILPQALIDIPKYGTINLHYSLLPQYRGATPVESAILHGDTVSGITIQEMRFKLDSGPIIFQEEIAIDPEDTTPTLRDKMNRRAQAVLPEVLKSIFDGTAVRVAQDDSLATRSGKITKEDGLITLDMDPVILDRKWRAYQPWPGLYFFKGGTRIKIANAHLADGTFVIDEVIPENGKRMPFSS